MIGRKVYFYAAAISMLVVSATVTFAQTRPERQRGGHGWGPESKRVRLYDPATVETIMGEIIEIAEFVPGEGAGPGVHLTLKTDAETIALHLGPSWFIEKQDLQFQVKDQIAVTGSRVNFDGEPALIAAMIQKGDDVLTLRDEYGVPRWSASGDRRPRMGRGAGGWGRNAQYQRVFNPATIETLTGEVVDIAYFTPPMTQGRGVHLTLKTEHETVSVHLGPAWFVENQDLQIEENDTVSIHGSRVTTVDGAIAIIATEVRKGEEILQLRDANGYPRWSGWRRARTSP